MASAQDPTERSPLLQDRDQLGPSLGEPGSLDRIDEESEIPSEISSNLSRFFSERQISLLKTVMGYCLVIFAGLTFTAANVVQKIVAPTLNFWHLLLYRAIAQTLVMVGFLLFTKRHLMGPVANRGRIFMQGALGGILLLCIFVAIKNVPLGNGSAIFFCTPVFTFIFAVCMLDENFGAYRSGISIFMVTGVVLITRPPFLFGPEKADDHHPVDKYSHGGYFCAVMVPLLSAIVSILTRQLKHVHPCVLMLWFAVGSFVVACGGIVFTHAGHLFQLDGHEWFCTAGIIALGMIGNFSYTIAVRYVSPSKANVFRSFEVILNYILQVTIEHAMFHWTNPIGIVFLLLAVFATGFESEVMKRYEERYSFL